MSIYFYDDTDDWPEYKVIKDDIQRLDQKPIDLSKELHKTEAAFGSDPTNVKLKAKIDRLNQKLKATEKSLMNLLEAISK